MKNILVHIFGPNHAIKYKLFVTCDMSQPCNMSHFEKIDKTGMSYGVKNSNFGVIFEAGTKSPHNVQKNIFISDVILGFCPSFKNEAET